jgi:hypothetical protein
MATTRPPSGERWLRENAATGERGYGGTVDVSYVATRCQAVEVARRISTVWRTVATGERGYGGARLRGNGGCVLCSHPLPSGGCVEENFHRLANGGYGNAVVVLREMSTVWRTVATGTRWLC